MQKNKIIGMIGFVLFCEFAGVIGSFFTMPSIGNWYSSLIKPDLNPPNWVFGPVWTLLYACMGIAAFLVWQRGSEKEGSTSALSFFALQLALNTVWSAVFFGAHSLVGALAIILALWISIAMTLILFYKISKQAAYLLVPYLLWVSFATYLNYQLVILN